MDMEKTALVGRRPLLKWAAAGIVLGIDSALPAKSVAAVLKPSVSAVDWSRRVIESNLTRTPDPTKFGGWNYPQGLFLIAQYLIYRRTHDPKLLAYIRGFVDNHVDASGTLDIPIEALDNVLGAHLLVILYEETREQKYKLAADKFRRRFDTYPRTTDGGFWHGNRPERAWQLWLDGNYMAVPFLLRYGRAFGDSDYACAEAIKQLVVYHAHLKSDHMGLLYHAWDESGKAPWADPVTHHSAFFWCRALGWYGMTLVDTLDVLPHNQPGREQLIAILRELVVGIAHYQDPQTGLWYQILDQPKLAGNWLETSSSSMFVYILDVAVKRGYISRSYLRVARKGYNGVMGRLTLGSDGLTNLAGICVGTNVGDLAWYLARPRQTNDFHGLGAFVLMNEEWTTSVSSLRFSS
jgi:unsaturated rhamnogalacturonyl hydrolase